MREGARDRAFIGEGDGKVGRNEKESGGGRGRVGEHELKMQYGEGETRNIPRKIARSWLQNEERREKSGLRRAKNERYPSKNRPKTDLKRGKAGKTEILE